MLAERLSSEVTNGGSGPSGSIPSKVVVSPAARIARRPSRIRSTAVPSDVVRSPLLGEHTEEILRDVLRFGEKQIAEIKSSGALGGTERMAAE